ncbi:MAG: hypothetical protein C4322_09350 [Mastigocladus sp. ERB_26_1]
MSLAAARIFANAGSRRTLRGSPTLTFKPGFAHVQGFAVAHGGLTDPHSLGGVGVGGGTPCVRVAVSPQSVYKLFAKSKIQNPKSIDY